MTKSDPYLPKSINTSVPHSARVYDCWLGGKDNFEPDRQLAARVVEAFPDTPKSCRENRGFLTRAVSLAAQLGITQFLDIGSGLPTVCNTHEVAQGVRPDARVVYVDHDPIVIAHGNALLTDGTPEGIATCVEADLREPEEILAAAAKYLDFTQPVAVMLVAILHFLKDTDDPHGIVRLLMRAVPPGSALLLSHMTDEGSSPEIGQFIQQTWKSGGIDLILRDRSQGEGFFEGLDLVEPGLVPVHQWHALSPWKIDRWYLWGAVAVKPKGDAR